MPEQIGNARRVIKGSSRTWRYAKRELARWRRRTEKRLLDDAPTRAIYSGWVD